MNEKPQLALYQPEIPHNTGTLIRLSACFGFHLHIIHPCGFTWSDKNLLRSGLDYHEISQLVHHASFSFFIQNTQGHRVILMDPKGAQHFHQVSYTTKDILLLGQESKGFPPEVLHTFHHTARIPMIAKARSINLALSGALSIGEALRQTNTYPGEAYASSCY